MPPLTREDLIGRYNAHAREYYRRADGTPTRHAANIELATRPLVSSLPASTFGLEALRNYREQLITRGLRRRTINQWVGWVRGMFRWAAQQRLVEPRIAAELSLLDPLRYGRSRAKESAAGTVVTFAMVRDLLPHLRHTVQRMLSVQWLTGMRPGELVAMKWTELVEVDGCTMYAPAQHKTKHFNRSRVIVLMPEVMALLSQENAQGDHVWLHARGQPFSTASYAQAVARACKRAGVKVWRPGRIRRSTATYARRVTDSETVQRLLGHASSDTTEMYYDLEVIDALEAAEKLNSAHEWREYRSELLKTLASGTR